MCVSRDPDPEGFEASADDRIRVHSFQDLPDFRSSSEI